MVFCSTHTFELSQLTFFEHEMSSSLTRSVPPADRFVSKSDSESPSAPSLQLSSDRLIMAGSDWTRTCFLTFFRRGIIDGAERGGCKDSRSTVGGFGWLCDFCIVAALRLSSLARGSPDKLLWIGKLLFAQFLTWKHTQVAELDQSAGTAGRLCCEVLPRIADFDFLKETLRILSFESPKSKNREKLEIWRKILRKVFFAWITEGLEFTWFSRSLRRCLAGSWEFWESRGSADSVLDETSLPSSSKCRFRAWALHKTCCWTTSAGSGGCFDSRGL